MRKKLLILLGAGSSVEQGLPSTYELNKEVQAWARDFAARKTADPIDAYTPLVRTDFFGRLWANRAGYCDGLSADERGVLEQRTEANYERVLGDLHALMNGVLPKPYGDPVLRFVSRADVFSDLRIAPEQGELDQHGSNKVFHAVEAQLKHLYEKLAWRIRGNSRVFEIDCYKEGTSKKFQPYCELMGALFSEFDVGIYNLNYDSVALNAFPNAFVGFDRKTGCFSPVEVLGRDEWGFLYHLHGSIHHRMYYGSHTMEDADFGPKIVWDEDLSQREDRENWEDAIHLTTQSDEKRLMLTSFIAGGWKLDQLQEEPFTTLYSCLPRHAYQADAIVIAGYGFGDSHVNSVLQNMLRSKTVGGRRPPVLVLDYEKNRLSTAKRGDAWASSMGKTLRVSPQSFRSPGLWNQQQWTELPDTVLMEEFEQSLRVPVATWNHGFTSVVRKLSRAVAWLHGDNSALGHGLLNKRTG